MFSPRTSWKHEENAYTRALRRHRESGKQIFDLTASNPTTCGFAYDQQAILSALQSPEALRYNPDPKGLRQAREAVAAYYGGRNGAQNFDPERLILTTSTSEAYSFLFRLLCEPGDEVLIAQPGYPLFDFLATIQDVKLASFRLLYDHGWQIDFADLAGKLNRRTRAILLVHPNNPTGHFTSEAEAGQLNTICLSRGIALVVDEVFLDYEIAGAASPRRRCPTFAFNEEALTFVLSGLSKISCLPQMKVAWIAAGGPGQLVCEAMSRLEIVSDTYLSLNAPVQHGLEALLNLRHGIQSQVTKRIGENLRELDNQVAGQNLVSRLALEGGWYAVLRVPAVQSDEELAIRLLEGSSVLVHPGHFYEFAGDGYLVVSLITPAEEFRQGIGGLLVHVAG
jgi:alanine-synthesizing transaminase